MSVVQAVRVSYVAPLPPPRRAAPAAAGRDRRGVLQTVVWWCLIAQPVVVRCPPHQILVAEPLQVLGRDVYPRRFRRGPGWGFGVHSGDCLSFRRKVPAPPPQSIGAPEVPLLWGSGIRKSSAHPTASCRRSSRRTRMLGSHRPTSAASIQVVCSSSIRKHDLGLQACQCGPDAEVCALAEGDMPFSAAAVEPELIGCVELLGVAVGGSPHQQQTGIGRHIDPGQRGVSHYVAVVTAKRRLVAQRLLDERTQQFGMGPAPVLECRYGSPESTRRCPARTRWIRQRR